MKDYKCSIIADPNGDAWDFASEVHDYLKNKIKKDSIERIKKFSENIRLCLKKEKINKREIPKKSRFACLIYEQMEQEDGDKLEMNPLEIKTFPDGEYKPRPKKNVRGSNCFFIHDSNLNPDKWANMLRLMNNGLRNSSTHEIINVLPYLKWSRQDRKDESRVPISAKDVADGLNFDHTRILTIDVHNDSIQGFYGIPFDSLPPHFILFDYLNRNHSEDLQNLVILAPDEGSKKRIEKYAKSMGTEIALLDKSRDNDGNLLDETLGIQGAEKIDGRVVLIPDDIISTGGTMIKAAKAARTEGATRVIGYGTHGLFTDGYREIQKAFDLIIIGDTIKQPYNWTSKTPFDKPDNLEVLSFAPLIGEAIYRINNNESLGVLFE